MNMYVSYKLREAKGLIVPKGPDFARAQSIHSDFDGSVLSFRAPKHRPSEARIIEDIPEQHYKLDTISRYFRCIGDDTPNTPNHFKKYYFFSRFWSFNGPWFTGPQAQLQSYITLVMPVNFDHEFSLFHPRAFEKLVGDYLTYLYSKHTNSDGSYHYTTPVNWQPLPQMPVPAARLEVISNDGAITPDPTHHVFFTISEQIMACAQFYPSRLLNLSKEELDKRVDPTPMITLINNIIDSFRYTLSPSAQAQQKKALAGLKETALVTEYPPLKWDKQNTASPQAVEEL